MPRARSRWYIECGRKEEREEEGDDGADDDDDEDNEDNEDNEDEDDDADDHDDEGENEVYLPRSPRPTASRPYGQADGWTAPRSF